MKAIFKTLATLFLVSHALPAHATDKAIITWYKPEFPPLSIVNGPNAGKGYSDHIEHFLISELTDYDHKILVAPFKRTLRDMKKGMNICSVTLLKNPEREQFVEFTKPARLLLPNSLIIRKSDRERIKPFINAEGKVEVERLIQSHDYRIGYSNGRSYTKPIDALLVKYKDEPILIERLGKEGPKGLLSMLHKRHIDAMFAQPVEAQFHGRAIGLADDIAILPIAEITDYTVGYIGCAKTPWGKNVINQINALLDTAVQKPEFRSYYEDFLDEDSKLRYRKIYDDFFGLR